jgi:dihydroxyacid dehydratase (EC 4.2.1.9)
VYRPVSGRSGIIVGRRKPEEITEAYYVGLMSGSGYRAKDLRKPVIAVVNSWTDVNPGHKPLLELARYVKEGIWAGGGHPGSSTSPPRATGSPRGPACTTYSPSGTS